VIEAGALGAAIMARVGAGVFPFYRAGVAAMVRLERGFEPDARQNRLYDIWFARYGHRYWKYSIERAAVVQP